MVEADFADIADRLVRPAPCPPAARRIIFLNRFFFPDHSATSQILTDLTLHLSHCGHDVHVVTSRQRYDDPQADLPAAERVGGVSVHRLATSRFGRSGLLGRGVDYLSFYRLMWRSVLALARPGDVLVAKTDPPLVSIPAMYAARRRGLRLINWLKDLYPEVAAQLGVPLLKGPLARGLLEWRDAGLRAAAANIVIGERMAEIVRGRGIEEDRIHLVPDWCDDEDIRPIPHQDNPLRRQWGLGGRFVVGYSGNLGKGHEFETVLGAAERLRDLPHLQFLFIGGGPRYGDLVRCVRERGLEAMFRFLPYQDRSRLRYSLGAADVHLLSLRPELEGLILPCKFYGIAAAGRPLVAITAPDGEIAVLARRHGCGAVVAPGEAEGLADVLRRLSGAPDTLAEMGVRARAMLDAHFTRRCAFERWRRVLETVA